MAVPEDTGVIHHDNEGPHVLSLDTLLLQPVSLQLQVMVGQLFDHKTSSTFKRLIKFLNAKQINRSVDLKFSGQMYLKIPIPHTHSELLSNALAKTTVNGWMAGRLFAERHSLLTNSCTVEHSWQDQQYVVRPVLPVQRHLKLLDHQDVQVRGAFHGMEKIEQAMLVASRGRGEDGTLQK